MGRNKQIRVDKEFDVILREMAQREDMTVPVVTKLMARKMRGDDLFSIPMFEKKKRKKNDKIKFI